MPFSLWSKRIWRYSYRYSRWGIVHIQSGIPVFSEQFLNVLDKQKNWKIEFYFRRKAKEKNYYSNKHESFGWHGTHKVFKDFIFDKSGNECSPTNGDECSSTKSLIYLKVDIT